MKIGKRGLKIALIVAVALVFVCICTLVLCGCKHTPNENLPSKKEYTLTFVTNGGSEIQPITALAGASIPAVSNPTKTDENGTYVFIGWYLNDDFSGESVSIPDKMPTQDVTYYALFELDDNNDEDVITIKYEINIDDVSYTSLIEDGKTTDIYSYKTADGSDFGVNGYIFLCWTTTPNGAFALSGMKENGQYYANETINSNDKKITLYAHWAKEYTDAYGKSSDKIYVCDEIIGKGLGAVTLVRDGKANKLGFVESGETTQSGYDEFTFYFDEEEGGIVSGRLYSENCTYAFPDGIGGEYLNYNKEYDEYDLYILVLDGFGSSMILEIVGSQTSVYYYGVYEYDEQYGDYVFLVLDPETQAPVVDENGYEEVLYFILTNENIEGSEFNGSFIIQGGESGSYLLYDNGEFLSYRLDLNGYGSAKLYLFDEINEETELLAEGAYKATENYESVYGEWQFVSNKASFYDFKFILSYVTGGDSDITIYIEYNPELNKTFSDNSGNGDTLYLDGYGGAMYTTNSMVMEGSCNVGNNLVTFVPYSYDENGNFVAGNKLYFNIDFATLMFTVNSDGFIVDGTTLVKYEGEADVVVIPEGITAIGDNAFNYTYTDVSLISVSIPESVVSIGKHAFQNGYTLQRAVFLSETPIAIDWSSDNDPFRWGSGNFVIIVPEGTQDEYKTAWSGCKYTIKGSVEVTILPEFEIVDGVLVAYNKQPDSADLLDIKIPDEVNEIAKNVFRGLSFINSVDFNNVTIIGEDSFYGVSSLTSAMFTNVQIIGDGAFMDCYNLGSVGNGKIELPKITNLGANAFSACESLKHVVLGEELVEIGDYAFSECQIYYGEDPLFVELLGENPPQMGGKVSIGNIAFRIKLQNIDVAVKCFDSPSWNSYVKHLYIESGSEKGVYLSGTDKLELNGRAEFFDSELMMYSIDSGYITFYWYDSETASYNVLLGRIENDTITLSIGATEFVFTKLGGVKTYVSADGKYTLECNPADLLPEAYEETGYIGVADGILNGTAVKINVNGYGTKIIKTYIEDGKIYNFSFNLDGDILVYEKKLADTYLRNIKASDGSEINLHITASLIYVFGTLNIEVADGVTMPSWGDYGTIATIIGNNVYKFTRNYRGTVYEITVTLSDDQTTFSYEYIIA